MNECLKIHRLANTCAAGPRVLRPFAGLLRHLNQLLFACHIGSNAQIGEGCIFQHNGVGTVISDHAVIGKNCIIYQGVTIGVIEDGSNAAPHLGNEVIVGANSTLLGDIAIGDRAKIGAGAVVLRDVPEGCTAVGVPAAILWSTIDQ